MKHSTQQLIQDVLSGCLDGSEKGVGMPRLDGNAIAGYFRTDNHCFYSYQIVPETGDLEFERVNPRQHPYLVGYYVGDVADVISPDSYGVLIYKEAARLDAKKCPNSVPCGEGCIPKGHKCRSKLGVRQQKSALQARKKVASGGVSGSDLAKIAGVATAGAVVGGAAAGVGAGVALDKSKQRREAIQKRVEEEKRKREEEEREKKRRSVKGRAKQLAAGTIEGAVGGGLAGGVAGVGVGSAVGAAKELVAIGADEVSRRSKRKSVKVAAELGSELSPTAIEGVAKALREQDRRKALKGVGQDVGRAAIQSGTSRVTKKLREN